MMDLMKKTVRVSLALSFFDFSHCLRLTVTYGSLQLLEKQLLAIVLVMFLVFLLSVLSTSLISDYFDDSLQFYKADFFIYEMPLT